MLYSPLFSVVIPAYNREHCIEKAIKSVLEQIEQSFEIIIVDDGSSDNTVSVVTSLMNKDSRIKIITQENAGACSARNAGINASLGRYIAFLDSDDVFKNYHLSQAREFLEIYPNACTYTQVIVDRGNNIFLLKPTRGFSSKEHISDYLMTDSGFVQTSTLIVPSLLAKKTLYNELISNGDDYDYAIRLVASGAELVMLDKPGAIWDDRYDPKRLSDKNNINERINWLNNIRCMITDKAYYSELGWPIAKLLSQNGCKIKAFKLYLTALCKGCFSPKMAIVVFLQVALSKALYRSLSDFLIKLGLKP